jgi:ABC-type multidrug transport system fused ATPase/permease subunit
MSQPVSTKGADADKEQGPSIEDSSSWLSYVFLTFLDGIFAKGYRQTLELSDLGGISKQDKSDTLHERFKVKYEKECKNHPLHKRSLWSVLWRTVGYWKLMLSILLFCISAALQFGPVMILNRLVRYFQGVQYYSDVQLWIMVALLLVFPVIGAMCLAHSNAIMAHLGAQIRNTLIGVIYRKALTVSPYRRQAISTGRIITMFSDDTNQVKNFLFFLNNSVCSPLQIGACLYLIYLQVGVATFVGLGYTVITSPLTGIVFSIVFKIRLQKMKHTDARVKLMNEILNGIRIIKYYAWENAFVEKVTKIRTAEVKLLEKMGYIFNSVFGIFMLGATQIQTVLIFLTYIGLGNQLDAATAFTTLTLFGLMTSPFIFLPYGLQQYNQSLIAMKRIMQFLDAEDVEPYVTTVDAQELRNEDDQRKRDTIVEFRDASFSWTPKVEEARLAEEAAVRKTAEADAKAASAAAAPSVSSTTELGAKRNEEMSAGGEVERSSHNNADYDAVSTSEPSASAEGEVSEQLKRAEEGNTAAPETVTDYSNKAIHTLRNFNFRVARGELVGIVGTVGSGKSSVLSALLGEMYLRSGEVRITNKTNADGAQSPPSIAYCDQRPWIINATIKDNILFGLPYDEERFNRAIYAACMDDDIAMLEGGVLTEIGERGINLSGGQKARVSLARAVYNDADVYLLDDPLSAVDAHVGEHIFSKMIKEELAGKTRFLVTHHLPVLSQCDFIVIMNVDGTVLASGSFDEILRSGIDVERYLGEDKTEDKTEDKPEAVSSPSTASLVPSKGLGAKPSQRADSATKPKKGQEESKLMTKEEKKEGSVSWNTYWAFIRYGGVTAFCMTILFQLFCQVLGIQANFWLADWGKETSVDNYENNVDMSRARNFHWFRGYCGMQMASIFCLFTSRMFLNYHRTNASMVFHQGLLKTVLSLPVSFFDVTPIGRVINRFSQDTATVDEELAGSISQVIGMGGGVLGALGAISGSTKGTFLILAVPLGLLYYRFQSYFRASNTAIARLEAVSRSPIYADFSQTLSGTSTIRAYHQQERFIKILEGFANRNTVPGVYQQIAGQWLGIRLDFLGALIMFFMGALTLALRNESFIPAGFLALGLSYSIQLTSLLKMAVRVSASMEAQFNSVERIKHYVEMEGVEGKQEPPPAGDAAKAADQVGAAAEEIDLELNELVTRPPRTVEEKEPPADWPQQGNVRFEQASMRYRDGPLVLKNVSFSVNAKDKIGIAGRTG